MNLPDRTSHLWLAGFALNKIEFDGYKSSPPHFFLHDLFHLVSLQLLLQSKNHISTDPAQDFTPENMRYALNEHNNFRKKYIYFLEKAKNCLKRIEEKQNISENKKKYILFYFFIYFMKQSPVRKYYYKLFMMMEIYFQLS